MGWMFRAGLWLAQWFSPAAALRVSGALAAVIGRFDSKVVGYTRANIDVCFPELSAEQRADLCRKSLQHMVLLVFEFAQLAHWPLEKLLSRITEVQGKAQLDELSANSEGGLILVPHFGNWELFCAFLGTHYGFAALYDPPKISGLEPVIVAARQRFNGQLFAIDAGGMRKLLKSLQRGKLVALLPDQVPNREQGLYAPFFGHPALTMTLAHRMAVKSQHRTLLAGIERVMDAKGYHYRLWVEPLVEDTQQLDAEAFAGVLNRSIERLVRRAPEQYQWEYKRFKRPPEGGKAPFYRRHYYRRQ
jgi:KDO2-lipid IV(A) lauroyltransferase